MIARRFFFRFVAVKGLRHLFVRKIPEGSVVLSSVPIETRMLSMDLSEAPNFSARLVELSAEYDTVGAKVLSGRLRGDSDLDLIYRYELDGSEGNADRLVKRLIRYFETGVDWDVSKEFLFKDVAPPPHIMVGLVERPRRRNVETADDVARVYSELRSGTCKNLTTI